MAVAILLFVVLQVLTRLDAINPFGVGLVPVDGIADPLAKGHLRLPVELTFRLAAIDGIPQVVPGTITDKFNQSLRFSEQLEQHAGQVDIANFLVTAEVVDLARLPLAQSRVDSPAVIMHVNPVADILPRAIHGQRLVFESLRDEEGNNLFRELVGPVIVGAASDYAGKPERVAI